MTTQQIADAIPSEYRVKILLEWLPIAVADMGNAAMQNLWNAWFLFVDPNGIQKPNCPVCVRNVLENWQSLATVLKEAEQDENLLKSL